MTATEALPQTTHVLFFDDAAPLIRAIGNGLLYAGDDRTVPSLTTIKFEFADGELRAAATNKYQLIVERVALKRDLDMTGQPAFDFLLQTFDAKALLSLLKAARRDPITLTYDQVSASVTLATLSGSVMAPVDADSRFPAYQSLMPEPGTEKPLSSIGFNRDYLSLLGKIQVEERKPAPAISVKLYGTHKPTRVDFINDGIVVLLMPVRLA